MLFALICTDELGKLSLRQDVRPKHVEFLNSLGERLKAAGPFLDPMDNPCGSLVIIEAKDMAEAKDVAAKDPYFLAGLFSNIEIRPWNWVFKNPGN